MEPVRLPLFGFGAFLILVALALEAGAVPMLGAAAGAVGAAPLPRPGLGIAYLALIDAVLLYSLGLLLLDQIGPLRPVLARVQWLATLLLALVGLIGTVVLVIIAITLLVLMVSLLLAVPFGTIAYMAAWGSFGGAKAKAVLGLAMALKLGGLVLAVAGYPSLPRNKGLLLLAATSLGATFLLGLLHGFPPGVLVSITDAVGAIIAGVLAAVWMLVFLIGAIPAGLKAIRGMARI